MHQLCALFLVRLVDISKLWIANNKIGVKALLKFQ